MRPMDNELRITTEHIGKEIAGKLFRPYAFETVGAHSVDTGVFAVAIKLHPNVGDPDFKEPIVILLHEDNVEAFIRAIRIAQAGTPANVRKGGSA
jgi:hypothetical protein